jgi:hypothetical protein
MELCFKLFALLSLLGNENIRYLNFIVLSPQPSSWEVQHGYLH